MSIKVTVTISATLRRASPEQCKKFNQPLGQYELIDSAGDRITWIDGSLAEPVAKMKAYDELVEPLLEDGYEVD